MTMKLLFSWYAKGLYKAEGGMPTVIKMKKNQKELDAKLNNS